MTEHVFKHKATLDAEVAAAIKSVNERLDQQGFTVIPIAAQPHPANTPSGWFTIGFTRVGLPEIYMSGVPPYGPVADEMLRRLREMFLFGKGNSSVVSARNICQQINEIELEGPRQFEWRPLNPERFMYGQGLLLRHWAESEGLAEMVDCLQVVHRSDNGRFPMVSSPAQLLVEYIPFGSKPYKSPYLAPSKVVGA